jgi:hypothetical protein
LDLPPVLRKTGGFEGWDIRFKLILRLMQWLAKFDRKFVAYGTRPYFGNKPQGDYN